MPANLEEVVSISVAGVATVAVFTDFGVALNSCCSRCRILLCIKSMSRVETWVVSVAGDVGSPATLADESRQVEVADVVSSAGTFPFDIWRDCAGVWR